MDKTVFCFASPRTTDYFRAFTQQGWACYPWSSVHTTPPDVMVFTGGPDVHPSLYGDDVNKASMFDPSGERDKVDSKAFEFAILNNIPILGICRGAQFLTAMAGGSLIQHVENHRQDHWIKTTGKVSFKVNSTHHQMMYPYSAPFYELLAWAEGLSSIYLTGDKLDTKIRYKQDKAIEPECVYYPHIQALAIQWHPERLPSNDEGYVYFIRKVRELLL